MTIVNAAGDNILVVGVDLKEGTNNATPTVLQFTVDLPKTGFYNLILRYKVRSLFCQLCFYVKESKTHISSPWSTILRWFKLWFNESHDFDKINE